MDGVGGCCNGDLGRLNDGPVVIAEGDEELAGAISAVGGGQNPVGRDERTSAEAGPIDKDGHLP